MLIWTRVRGSQRRSRPKKVTIEENFGGQGGCSYIAFWDGAVYTVIQPESVADARLLQSHAAIVALNVKE